jgi:hypothetical protein
MSVRFTILPLEGYFGKLVNDYLPLYIYVKRKKKREKKRERETGTGERRKKEDGNGKGRRILLRRKKRRRRLLSLRYFSSFSPVALFLRFGSCSVHHHHHRVFFLSFSACMSVFVLFLLLFCLFYLCTLVDSVFVWSVCCVCF